MATASTATLMLIRVTGVILLILGALFWTGNARDLVPWHIAIGIVLVIALWVLAIMAALAGVSAGPVVLAVLWGFLVLAFGMAQSGLLVGNLHWVTQVLHVLVGLAAMGQAEMLVSRIRRARPQET
jgi:hypothetical protein